MEFEGKPAGIDKGGLFQPTTRELRVICLPDDIPNSVTVDISGLDIGDSLHIGDITLPNGVTAAQDAGVALASVAAPMKEEARSRKPRPLRRKSPNQRPRAHVLEGDGRADRSRRPGQPETRIVSESYLLFYLSLGIWG